MVSLATIVIVSYLLGSIPFGYMAGRIGGIDIRKAGSGNVGATNVVRVLGKRYGYPVFALDVLKGFGAVKISMVMRPDGRRSGIRPRYLESSQRRLASSGTCIRHGLSLTEEKALLLPRGHSWR